MIADYEIKNQKEIAEYIDKVNYMRQNLEKQRDAELDALNKKYDKIKIQLKSI